MNDLFLYDQIKGNDEEKRLFALKVRKIAAMLATDPNYLMLVMYFESRLNPQAKNSYSGAVGLIQFMPATCKALGTTSDAMILLPGYDQLDYVYKYLRSYSGNLKTVADVYLTVFYPYAVNKTDDYVLGSQTGEEITKKIAQQNPIFDKNKDLKITKREVVNYFTMWAASLGYENFVKVNKINKKKNLSL